MTAVFHFDVGVRGRTSASVVRAAAPLLPATLLLAHGAGAPRTHPFMVDIAERLARRGLDVVTFNFLYAEVGRRLPDRPEVLEETWRAAIAAVRARSGLASERLFIGGKSMGGRFAARIAATHESLVVPGLVLLGYPLHPPGKPEVLREEILAVGVPTLVVQGTRDELGTAAEVKRFVARMAHAKLHVVRGGDHSLAIPRSEGPAAQERALEDAAAAIAAFIEKHGKARRKRRSSG